MKKVLLLGLAVFGLAGLSGLNVNNAHAVRADGVNYISGENVIHNGDFAIGPSEWKLTEKAVGTAKWLNWVGPEATQVATVDPTNPDNTVLRFSTYEGAGFSSMFVLMSNITPGSSYKMQFDYLAPAACDNVGIAFWCTSLGNRLPELNVLWDVQVNEAGAVITDLEDGWKHVEWTRTFDAAQTYDSAHIWCNVGAGSVYFDNFSAIANEDATTELFAGGDFEGWLDAASATVPAEADENGISGVNATYVQGGVKLAAGGHIQYDVELAEENYSVKTVYEGEGLKAALVGKEGELPLTSGTLEYVLDGAATGATGVKFVNTSEADITLTSIEVKAVYESTFDPNATYYESESLTVNGDFEAFDVGTRFSDAQLEGAWGSVAAYDNPARICEVDGSKAAVIGKHDADDTKTFSSMFLMTPEGLEIGDILRIKYDFKLTVADEKDSYAEINSSLVGGANVPYYLIDLRSNDTLTGGAEKAPYIVKYETLENGWARATLDFEVSNDIIQWNSLRWLFTAHEIGDLLAIDNVNIHYLSTTPFTNPVTSITIAEGDQVLEAGQTKQLTYTVNPEDHDEATFTWSSSNTAVATVSETGLVTAVAEGSAEIKVTADNGVEASIIVTVTATEEPETPKGGCGGSIIGASVIVTVSAAVGALGLFLKKRKETK